MIPREAWTLRAANDNRAALDFSADPSVLRVAITHVPTPTSHDIQLNAARLAVRAGQRCELALRIRADAPRRCGLGVARAHHPWDNLGCYRVLALTTVWQHVHESFIVADDVSDARIHIDLGGAAVAVEIADVRLHDLDARVDIVPAVSDLAAPRAVGPDPTEVSPGGLILMYHRIAADACDPWGLCVSPDRFAAQMEVLGRIARPIGLSAFAAALLTGSVPPRAVVVTFDDGYADNLQIAAPILRRAGVPATVFVSTGQIGGSREFWWDELAAALLVGAGLPHVLEVTVAGKNHRFDVAPAPSEVTDDSSGWRAEEAPPTSRHTAYLALWRLLVPLPGRDQRVALDSLWQQVGRAPVGVRPTHRTVSPEELIELDRIDGISIGAHTVTHPMLPARPAEDQRYELLHSKVELERLLRGPVTAMSYPYGAASEVTARLARELGYRVACTTMPGRAHPARDRFRLPRVQVLDWTADVFAGHIAAWLPEGR